MDQHVRSEFASPPWHLAHLFPGRQLHVSDRSISVKEFTRYQRRAAERDLADLVWRCRDRYLYAHDLLHPHAPLPGTLEDGANADLTELLYPWDALCVTYRRIVFDSQIDLFLDQQHREFERWHTFRRRRVIDPILACPEWTRTVLEVTHLLDRPTSFDGSTIDVLFENLINTIEWRYAHDHLCQD